MELDHDHCYAIIKSRDERYDGRFFTAVLTTGIYCRPICPARTPKAEHVRFYPCAAAAEAAGFRPCLRCRPEASPGTPAWEGASATVARALHLIEEGALDEGTVDDLAARLHVSARQLRRLFLDQLGVPPVAVAQTRRVQFAKKLLDETTLPISDVAFCAGFSSIRRFNYAIRTVYGRTPSELRGKHRADDSAATLDLKLAYRPPFDWDRLRRTLQPRLIPGVEVMDESGYGRTIRLGDQAGILTVTPVPDDHYVRLRVPVVFAPHLLHIVERTRRLFDLRADPAQITGHLCRDPLLADALNRIGTLPRVSGAWDPFETTVRIILGQMVSVKSATTLAGRLVRAYGEPISTGREGLTAVFPRPADLADAPLTEIGLSRQRAAAIRELARQVACGELSFSTFAGLDEAIERFTALPGIGSWTAHMIALRVLGEPDAFPVGDLGVRRALGDLNEKDIQRRAESWRPWRAYATLILWAVDGLQP